MRIRDIEKKGVPYGLEIERMMSGPQKVLYTTTGWPPGPRMGPIVIGPLLTC